MYIQNIYGYIYSKQSPYYFILMHNGSEFYSQMISIISILSLLYTIFIRQDTINIYEAKIILCI